MSTKGEELIKKPLYVFDLPSELLVTLHQKASTSVFHLPDSDASTPDRKRNGGSPSRAEDSKSATSCLLCGASYLNVQEQRQHVRSDWHNYNLKRKLRGGKPVVENEFEKLVEDLDESLSGSGSNSSESEEGNGQKDSTLSALLKKQVKISNGIAEEEDDFMPKKRKRGAGKPPLLWFTSSLLSSNTSLGVYRALFTGNEQEQPDILDILKQKQLRPVPAKPPPMTDTSNGVPLPSTMTSPSIFMCMVGGGHFAGMIVSLAPKIGKQSTGPGEQRQAVVIAHKTFHRYTTRRKQGGGQSANDSAKGAAHSAGSSLRRYNEAALEQEIRALLSEWRDMIGNAQLIFVRATGSSNRRILFGPYEGQVLHHNDPRNRTFPFSTRRATQAELMRAFVELTRVKVSEVDEAALAAAAAEAETAATSTKPPSTAAAAAAAPPQPSKEEELATLHTSQLTALIRRSRAPALLSYLTTNALSPDHPFFPPSSHAHHHAPTPLHLAASTNSSACVSALLVKAGADPTLRNGEAKTAFELCGERATRDAFRVGRHELGEEKWDWEGARVPEGLSKVEAEERAQRERAEAEKRERERRKGEEERLMREGPKVEDKVRQGGSVMSGMGNRLPAKTAEEKREEEGRGLTPEMRQRMERERRARAAEARFAKR